MIVSVTAMKQIVLVHPALEASATLQNAIKAAGYQVSLAEDLIRAIDLIRVTPVVAMIAVVPRGQLTHASTFLRPGEQFPPSVIVCDDREAVGIRASAVVTLSVADPVENIIGCLGAMIDCVGPMSDNRTLPLRMTRVPSGKFSSWLVPPSRRARHDSDWR
jgi:hypothetical protein